MDKAEPGTILTISLESSLDSELERLQHRVTALEAACAELQQENCTAQQRLRTLIDHAPEALVLLDGATARFLDANPMAEQLFGLPRDRLLEISPFALSPPAQFGGSSLARGMEMLEEALRGGTPVFEWWHCNARGERFPCEVRLLQIPWGDRDVIRGAIIDISHRKHLELSELGRRQMLECIARGASLNAALETLVRTIEGLFPGMICSALLLEHETNRLRMGAAPSLPDFYNAAVDGLAIGPAVGSCGAAAFTGQRVIVSDVEQHPNWAEFQPFVKRAGIQACWSEPILSLSGQVLGTFAMYYGEPREPAPVELRAMELAAHLASLVIEHENAQKLERSRLEQAELTLLSRSLDFEVAKRIQRKMLPRQSPPIAGFDIAGRCCPAKETGGDFFDYHPLPGGRLGLVVADVSSHGFAPALIMAETRRLLRTLARANCAIPEILTVANAAVYEDTDDAMFVTVFLAQLDPLTQTLSYIGAGHEAFVLKRSGTAQRLESSSLPLGVIEDLEFPAVGTVTLHSGDLLLLLSDGFHEARAANRKLFGIDRVLEIARANAAQSAAEILDAVFQAAEAFCRPASPGDDMTALIVKVQQECCSLN